MDGSARLIIVWRFAGLYIQLHEMLWSDLLLTRVLHI
jgi:hypothetical protein